MVNCLAGMFNYGMAIPSVGPARCRPPRHNRMPFNSINESSKCLSMTWRTTIFAGPYFSVQVAAENRADEDSALPMMSSIMYYVASPFGFALAGLLPNWAYRPAVATWQGLTLGAPFQLCITVCLW